jgi:hypothetical protein
MNTTKLNVVALTTQEIVATEGGLSFWEHLRSFACRIPTWM